MIGGKFATLTILNNEDADIDSMTTTFNTKPSEEENPGSLPIFLICETKKFKPEGSEKFRKVNSNTKRCMKKWGEMDRRTL